LTILIITFKGKGKTAMILEINYETDYNFRDYVNDDNEWKIYSFSKRHANFMDPLEFIKLSKDQKIIGANIGIERKLNCGTAFILSCYQHGEECWSLKGEGTQCRFDTAIVAGIMLFNSNTKNLPADIEDRKKRARNFLDWYNELVNGGVLHFCLKDDDENHLDSCGGFVGEDDLMFFLKTTHPKIFSADVGLTLSGNACCAFNI
jgi:hypothetical protein